MAELLVVAFLGGLITSLSPCIVPVLPVILAGGTTDEDKARPYLIITGLVLSFSFTELFGVFVLSEIGLPQNFLTWLGEGMLFVLAAGLLIPVVGQWIEKPFSRLGANRYAKRGGGLVLGLSLGFVFVPCAGPVLGAISAAAARHRFSASSLIVILLYAAGAALPLLGLSVAAQRAATSWSAVRRHLPMVRKVAGAVLAVTALAITLHWLDPLQRALPGYTSAFQNHVENSSSVAKQLQSISGEKANQFASAAKHQKSSSASSTPKSSATDISKTALPKLGKAPNFTGIVSWLNTPGNQPLTLNQLRGKVVLIDFWTYSCINCQRSLPHVEGWYKDYKNNGLVVVGVSTPEFAFEHVVSNVQSAGNRLGIHYPIAIDNNYGTWYAYNNNYWPAEYLIDPTGQVRAYDFGEGGYSTMERNIRTLLASNSAATLPTPTDVPDKTPTNTSQTQESYVGYQQREQDSSQAGIWEGTPVVHDKATVYHAPSTVDSNDLALNGTWSVHSEEATAGSHASMLLHFTADDVYLVLGGQGTVDVSFNGHHVRTINVSGVPTLHTLLSGNQLQSGLLTMTFSPGVEAYDFTFG